MRSSNKNNKQSSRSSDQLKVPNPITKKRSRDDFMREDPTSDNLDCPEVKKLKS